MKNALILHGIGNKSNDNWFPWLRKELEKKDYEVWSPDLPQMEKPNLESIYNFVKSFSFSSETVLIGHSSGATLALGILQKLPPKIVIKKTILVAGFTDSNLKPELFKYVSKSDYTYHFPKKWDWMKIRKSSKEFIIFDSPSDPYVQTSYGKFLKEKLLGELITVLNAGHFSISTKGKRFKEFPELLKYIK